MLKRKNKVITREQLNEAKALHKEAYEAYIEVVKQAFESDMHKGWSPQTRHNLILNDIPKPKTMNICVKEVTQPKGDTNGI